MAGSVMMVAGLEFTRMTRKPSSLQRLAGLGAGVVELAGLADDDGPAPRIRMLLMSVRFGMFLQRLPWVSRQA